MDNPTTATWRPSEISNYAACLGDSPDRAHGDWQRNAGVWRHNPGLAPEVRASQRGVFRMGYSMRFRDILDGLSNAIAAGEIATDLGDKDNRTIPINHGGGNWNFIRTTPPVQNRCQAFVDTARPQFWTGAATVVGATDGRGYRWADSGMTFSSMLTANPLNKLIIIAGLALAVGCGEAQPTNVADGASLSEVEQYRAMLEESQNAEAEAAESAAGYKAGPEG